MAGNSQYVFVREALYRTVYQTGVDATSVSFPHTVPVGTFRLLTIFVCAAFTFPDASAVSSVKFGTADATFQARQLFGGTHGIELWTLVGPLITTDTITVTWPILTDASVIVVCNLVGVNATTPINGVGTEFVTTQQSMLLDSLPVDITVPSVVIAGAMLEGRSDYMSPSLKSNMLEIADASPPPDGGSSMTVETFMFLPETALDKAMQINFVTNNGVGIIAQVNREPSLIAPGLGWAW